MKKASIFHVKAESQPAVVVIYAQGAHQAAEIWRRFHPAHDKESVYVWKWDKEPDASSPTLVHTKLT